MTAVIERTPAVAAPASTTMRAIPSKRTVGTFQCLIVSNCDDRLAMLEQAAFDGGWSTVACGDGDQAWMAVKRQRFQLVIVDLDTSTELEHFKDLSKDISESSNVLLVLCGTEGNGLEEIWARQLGAWLYLPGVTTGSDVAFLCEQAMPVAEKLNGKSNQQVTC